MQPLMRVLLCGILVVTFTLDKVHCMDPPDSNNAELGATGYTPSSRNDDELGATGGIPPPPSYNDAIQEWVPTGGIPPPPYDEATASPEAASQESQSVDLVKASWSVHGGTSTVEKDTICFKGFRPQLSHGKFHFSAEVTVMLPTYAGYLSGDVHAKEKCRSKPEFEIQTQYRWGWETVMKKHPIPTYDEASFEKVPVYGQPLFGPNLMFVFTTPSKHCQICFGPLQVTPNALINHLVLSKPKEAEATACTGQWQPVKGEISLPEDKWESVNDSAQSVGLGTNFCIVPTKKGIKMGKMEIEVKTHSAELIRFLQGTVTSRCSTDVKMKVWTNVPGTGVQTYREMLHPSQPVAFKAPVYACTNEKYHLLNITLRFTGKLDKASMICFDDLRLPQPLAA